MEATLILATITARWHLTGVPGAKVRTGRAFLLTPHGLRLRATARLHPGAASPAKPARAVQDISKPR